METNGDRIILSGMTFYGYHGAKPEERALGQRFVVDVEVGADLADAGLTDDLSRTIDYGELYRATKGVLEGEPLNLLEAVAQRVAEEALKHERVQWARVCVRKPSVPIKGSILAEAAVEIVRFREGSG